MSQSVYLALDVKSLQEAKQLLENNSLSKIPVKVGMQLFYREGEQVLAYLKEQGYPVFLDLKLHDIPNTVKESMRSLAQYEPDLINVHAAGGMNMIEAAKEGLIAENCHAKLLAVTQLTSTDEQMLNNQLLISQSMDETVKHYASISQQSGADGVVCSVLEVPSIKQACGEEFLALTPGIRLSESEHDDQKRVATPKLARKTGSDMIVVGRTVTNASNPKEAYEQVLKEWSSSHVKQ
ncbi:orotidine-5'-phosphate decarboxylase [Alkalibacillus haloalkaliphilus]|uniref:orotidine-5'-phosphate decarboxylase n=1 Tax=Alkalibacillus haloalkaliphilus TaxID=94136 RepID=UPI002936756E|nr:orotidine-5'-phosphate decarboxylase [Alkalibacillus haloalkaliphilus]MDV2582575.1 orotidine-5'-phosphate decarboxylase [Alkalibacillus haloalkaliphilus]